MKRRRSANTMSECFKLKMARSLLLCLRRTVLCLGSAKPFTREWQKWWQKREKSTCQWQQALSGRRSASRLSARCCDVSADQDRDHQQQLEWLSSGRSSPNPSNAIKCRHLFLNYFYIFFILYLFSYMACRDSLRAMIVCSICKKKKKNKINRSKKIPCENLSSKDLSDENKS